MTGEIGQYLVVGAILFSLGAFGFLTRRNLIVMFLSVELMLQGVAVNLLAFGRYHGNLQGQAFTVFLLTVAACEGALALAFFVAFYQRRRTLDVAEASDLGERDQLPPELTAPPWQELVETPPPLPMPHLAPAGREPKPPQEATLRV